MRDQGEGERPGEDRGGLVRGGDLHTYKIHLGSINILTHPDDSYLCIVPAQRSGDGKVCSCSSGTAGSRRSSARRSAGRRHRDHRRVHPHADEARCLTATVTFQDETATGKPLTEWEVAGLPERMTERG
ncbi:DUF7737 domain-containing protein [Streptomyces sp. NPDC003015]